MGIYENVKEAAEKRGYSINRLEKEMGLPRSSISKYNRNTPSAERLQAIATFLNVPVGDLTGDTSSTSEFTARNDEERRLLVLFRNTDSVPDEEREEIIRHFESTVDIYLKAKGIIK